MWFDIIGNIEFKIEESYDEDKNIYRLTLSHNKDRDLIMPITVSLIVKGKEQVYNYILDNSYKTFTFKDVSSQPIVCVNPDFASPVEISQHQSREELNTIIKITKFPYAKYIAMHKYILSSISDKDYTIASLMKTMLKDKSISSEIKVKLLSVPSSSAISSMYSDNDFEKSFKVRENFIKEIATELRNEFSEILNNDKSKEFKNLALCYLSRLPDYKNLVIKTYYDADDMTTKFNAFVLIVSNKWQEKEDVIADFYNRYKDNHLVINKWFAAIALSPLSDTLQMVKQLTRHKDFSFANPNKVYALIGSFARNSVLFHNKDGAGYEFLADCIIAVDKENPQIANVLLDFFGIHKVDNERDILVKNALKRIKSKSSMTIRAKIDSLL